MSRMSFITQSFTLLASFASLTMARPSFSGNFVLSNLVFDSLYQARPASTINSSISFDFFDQDLPQTRPVQCSVEWAVGTLPPSTTQSGRCEDIGIDFWFPEETYRGTTNFTIALSHTYVDDSVGIYPYNTLTKFAELNLTYPGTLNYECDAEEARCRSCDGTSMIAPVTRAVA